LDVKGVMVGGKVQDTSLGLESQLEGGVPATTCISHQTFVLNRMGASKFR